MVAGRWSRSRRPEGLWAVRSGLGPGGNSCCRRGGAGLTEAWLLVEASQLRQKLLDKVLRTGEGAENTGMGGGTPLASSQPFHLGPLFSRPLASERKEVEVRRGRGSRWRRTGRRERKRPEAGRETEMWREVQRRGGEGANQGALRKKQSQPRRKAISQAKSWSGGVPRGLRPEPAPGQTDTQ